MEKMNPEVKAKWVAALRSGNYQKGELKLKTAEPVRYCCLGVLCEIYAEETKMGTWNKNNCFSIGEEYERYYLPEKVAKWAGIDETGLFEVGEENWNEFLEFVKTSHGRLSLSVINDIPAGVPHHDPTFETIINLIEKYF